MAAPSTVTVHHPDKGALQVTPEVAQALTAGSYGAWTRDVDPSEQDDRVAELEAHAAELQEALDYVVAVGAAQDAKIAELEQAQAQSDPSPAVDDQMPEKAADRVKWIGADPERAQAALDDETARGDDARSTVTDHARSVLDTTPIPDQAGSGQED